MISNVHLASPKQKSRMIGIDGNEANIPHRVGSNQYAYELLISLSELNQKANSEANKFVIYLKDKPLSDMPKESISWQYRVIRSPKLWTQWRLPLDLYLHSPRPQVFFSPGHYAPRYCPVPSVVTILDLAFLEYPSLFLKYERGVSQLSRWTAYSVKQASRIIAISNHTKSSLIKHYQLNPSKIKVAYPGIDTSHFRTQSTDRINEVLEKYQLQGPYLLYVGTLQPRKNLSRLIEAFASLPPKYNQYHLVLAGSTGWLMDDLHAVIKRAKVDKRLHLPGYIEANDLPALYSGATTTVLVGLEEGFGIPPAEALACGTMPLVSQTGALPEVVGPDGLYVDPFSVNSIKNGIIQILEMAPAELQRRIAKCQNYTHQFTWEKSAAIVLETLYAVAL